MQNSFTIIPGSALKKIWSVIIILSFTLVTPACAQQGQEHSEWEEESPPAGSTMSPGSNRTSSPPASMARRSAVPKTWTEELIMEYAKTLSPFEKICLLELDVFGKTFPFSTKDPVERLKALEKSVLGESNEQAELIPRIDALLRSLQPSKDLVSFVVIKATSKAGWSFKSKNAPWVMTTMQTLSSMEIELNGKTAVPGSTIIERIANLEKSSSGLQATELSGVPVQQRLANLRSALPLSKRTIEKAKKDSDTDDSFIENIVDSLGKHAKKLAKGTKDKSAALASSPAFWTLLLGAGAITTLIILEANNKNRGSGSNSSASNFERGCRGTMNCHYCTNCRYCQYCNTTPGCCNVKLQILRAGGY